MQKIIARAITYLFHPLLMTTLGMFIIFHSGTSLSVLQPEVKRIVLIAIALLTSIFPALIVVLLTLTKVTSSLSLLKRSERMLPFALTIVLYMLTFLLMRSVPQLSKGHQLYLFAAPLSIFIAMVFNHFMKVSMHALAMGMLSSLIFALVVFYGAGMQFLFVIVLVVSGLVGSAQLMLQEHTQREVYLGYLIGLVCTISLLLMNVF